MTSVCVKAALQNVSKSKKYCHFRTQHTLAHQNSAIVKAIFSDDPPY